MWTMKEYSGKENQRIKFPPNPSPEPQPGQAYTATSTALPKKSRALTVAAHRQTTANETASREEGKQSKTWQIRL